MSSTISLTLVAVDASADPTTSPPNEGQRMAAGGRSRRTWSSLYLTTPDDPNSRAYGTEAPGRGGGRALAGPLRGYSGPGTRFTPGMRPAVTPEACRS
jgi:hypothetical protein